MSEAFARALRATIVASIPFLISANNSFPGSAPGRERLENYYSSYRKEDAPVSGQK